MISYKKIGKTLVGPAILLVKTLQGVSKLLVTFFGKLFNFSAWLLHPFIWHPFLKIYGQYLLNLKNVRKIKTDQEIRLALLRKYAAPSLIVILTVGTSLYNLSLGGGNFNVSEKMNQAVVTSLVKNEFGQSVGVNEYIKEKAGKLDEIYGFDDKYPTGAIKSPLSIYTNTEAPKNTDSFSWLLNDYLFYPGKTSIGTIDTSSGSDVTSPLRNQVVQYTVQNGDSLSSIARSFGVSLNTVLWANNLTSRSVIRQGDKLTILPQSGVMYKVVLGDSLQRIARKYDIDEDKIIATNNIDNAGMLRIGQQLILPGASKISSSYTTTNTGSLSKPVTQTSTPKPGDATVSATKLQWPTVGYRITQYYSWRHTGLDIANKTGTPLYASEDGVVEIAGWNSGGYGYQVLINHGGGIKTRYAHSSKLYVVAGQKVSRGEMIAAMGSTGRSTGPHIHYEVIINGVRVNPLNYIR